MVTLATIALIALLIGFRLLMPPFPTLFRKYMQRWGAPTTVALCMIAISVVAVVILLTKHS